MDTSAPPLDPDLEALRQAGLPPVELLREVAVSLRDVDALLADLGQRLADAARIVAAQAELISPGQAMSSTTTTGTGPTNV